MRCATSTLVSRSNGQSSSRSRYSENKRVFQLSEKSFCFQSTLIWNFDQFDRASCFFWEERTENQRERETKKNKKKGEMFRVSKRERERERDTRADTQKGIFFFFVVRLLFIARCVLELFLL